MLDFTKAEEGTEQIARLLAAQDAIHIGGGATKGVCRVD
jgi:hypothetical protein